MIKKIPDIYPNELFYSFLSRFYVQSGIGSSKEFTKLIFEKGNEQPKSNFINKLSVEFKEILNTQISDEDIVIKHTCFNYYGRYLKSDEKKEAIKKILEGENAFHHLKIPVAKKYHYLRYCPKCVELDREKYGECYFHIEHQIDDIRICPHHKCLLNDTIINNGFNNQLILTPLEMCDISDEIIDDVIDSLEIDFTNYIYEFLVYPLYLDSNINIGNVLESKLDDKYYSSRGEKKKLVLLYSDIKTFYSNYGLFNLSKERISKIYKGKELNIHNILELAFYEGVSIKELCEGVIETLNRQSIFDKKVKDLFNRGYSYTQIGNTMKVGHQVIRNIISGRY